MNLFTTNLLIDLGSKIARVTYTEEFQPVSQAVRERLDTLNQLDIKFQKSPDKVKFTPEEREEFEALREMPVYKYPAFSTILLLDTNYENTILNVFELSATDFFKISKVIEDLKVKYVLEPVSATLEQVLWDC